MKFYEEASAEPWRFDFFWVMRLLERTHSQHPRIGDSGTLREDYAALGQDPYFEFPASNLTGLEKLPDGRTRLLVRFLGLMGPQGALPLSTTEEAYLWNLMRDDAFPRFLDIFNNRFLQLFFRAWSDARPIAQHDRPREDRFITYIGSTIGLGSAIFRDLDSVPDPAKLAFAGLIGAQTRGASRLRNLVSGMFNVDVEVDEFVGSYLEFDPDQRTRLGMKNSGLGSDMLMGASVYSIEDKFRVRIYVEDMGQYVKFLPTGNFSEPLADLVFFYIGEQLAWEVELAIPAGKVEPMRLSKFGQLGWTSWMSPKWAGDTEAYRRDARFHPADILKQKRERAARSARG